MEGWYMNTFIIYAIAIFLSTTISATVVMFIKSGLRDMLIETCGTEKRADFWVMYTQIMLFISPLLVVIYLAPITSIAAYPAELLKNILFWSLLVVFIALAKIGRVIWKSINTDVNEYPVTHENKLL